jgi:uncharacterized protein YbjT (DUF2867 family)
MRGMDVLVAGATGRLGGIVALLLERGHAVRALARDPGSAAAAAVRDLGAEVVGGDYDDVGSLVRAATGADALFATGTAHRVGPEGERRHGANVAHAAAAARVPHLIYVSGEGASPDSPLPLFRAKAAVESDIRGSGVPATILAPVYFAENLFNPWNLPALREGVFPSPVPVDLLLQQATIRDVIRLAALAIERTAEFAGRRVVLASDEVTAREAAAAVTKVTDRDLVPTQVTGDRLAPPLRALFAWLEQHPGSADIEGLRRAYPEVGWQRYPEWAAAERERFRELCPEPHAAPV